MPLQATSGAASYDAFGGGVAAVPNYIEDVFSTYLYTGTGSTQTITNGIDLSTKGGLVWTKTRTGGAGYDWHVLVDSARGVDKVIQTNLTDAESTQTDLTSFTTTGYNLAAGSYYGNFNFSGAKFVSWTFRKQPKFFDVVTWTGDSTAGRTVAHNLGSVPACIIVKRTDAANGWPVYHRSMNASPQNYQMRLNATTEAFTSSPSRWNDTLPTSTEFTLSANDEVNGSGGTYVAYLFAHDAGGFGLTGTDNVIWCGSYTEGAAGTEQTINLGYEVQWLLIKPSSISGTWYMYDTMRGLSQTGNQFLRANASNAESAGSAPYLFKPAATGFIAPGDLFGPGATITYIAIRRGPMKVPTSGTSVFDVDLAGNSSAPSFTSAFPVDLGFIARRSGGDDWYWVDRLRGTPSLSSNNTSAEASFATLGKFDYMNGYGSSTTLTNYTGWNFRRAPSFFDEVCYTGDSTDGRSVNHNLGVEPELMIVKTRSGTTSWQVYAKPLGVTTGSGLLLDSSDAAGYNTVNGFYATPTSSVFYLGTGARTNVSSATYVNYLFATCAGVSKVFSYTGNGSSQTINCGFTGGARFVLIKRTDDVGDWYVWDSARGIVSGNDPHLSLNSTAAEVTSNDTIDTDSTGFVVNQVSATNVNVSSATYIGLAIA